MHQVTTCLQGDACSWREVPATCLESLGGPFWDTPAYCLPLPAATYSCSLPASPPHSGILLYVLTISLIHSWDTSHHHSGILGPGSMPGAPGRDATTTCLGWRTAGAGRLPALGDAVHHRSPPPRPTTYHWRCLPACHHFTVSPACYYCLSGRILHCLHLCLGLLGEGLPAPYGLCLGGSPAPCLPACHLECLPLLPGIHLPAHWVHGLYHQCTCCLLPACTMPFSFLDFWVNSLILVLSSLEDTFQQPLADPSISAPTIWGYSYIQACSISNSPPLVLTVGRCLFYLFLGWRPTSWRRGGGRPVLGGGLFWEGLCSWEEGLPFSFYRFLGMEGLPFLGSPGREGLGGVPPGLGCTISALGHFYSICSPGIPGLPACTWRGGDGRPTGENPIPIPIGGHSVLPFLTTTSWEVLGGSFHLHSLGLGLPATICTWSAGFSGGGDATLLPATISPGSSTSLEGVQHLGWGCTCHFCFCMDSGIMEVHSPTLPFSVPGRASWVLGASGGGERLPPTCIPAPDA